MRCRWNTVPPPTQYPNRVKDVKLKSVRFKSVLSRGLAARLQVTSASCRCWRRFVLLAALDLNGDVDKLFMLVEQVTVGFHRFRVVGHDAHGGGELARADPPDVKVQCR